MWEEGRAVVLSTPHFLWLKLGQVLLRSLQQLSLENERFPKGLGHVGKTPVTLPPGEVSVAN